MEIKHFTAVINVTKRAANIKRWAIVRVNLYSYANDFTLLLHLSPFGFLSYPIFQCLIMVSRGLFLSFVQPSHFTFRPSGNGVPGGCE